MLTSDRIAAGRLHGLKWGIVVALVANQSYAHRFNLSRRVSPTSAEACHEDIYNAFLESQHYQVDTEKHGRWKGQPLAHRRGLSEMSLQSVHTNWADPRLAP